MNLKRKEILLNGNSDPMFELNGHHYLKKENQLITEWVNEYDETKIRLIAGHIKEIMLILGMDLSDDSLKGTPGRVAKMYVKEIFSGLNTTNEPVLTVFENKNHYSEMLIEKNITVYSNCEHHLLPIIGKAHVAYYANDKIIGLSKINRIVQYYSKRPQVQERLTEQVAEAMKKALQTDHVAVVIDATHLCVASRGASDVNSNTITSHYSGKFNREEIKKEFLSFIK